MWRQKHGMEKKCLQGDLTEEADTFQVDSCCGRGDYSEKWTTLRLPQPGRGQSKRNKKKLHWKTTHNLHLNTILAPLFFLLDALEHTSSRSNNSNTQPNTPNTTSFDPPICTGSEHLRAIRDVTSWKIVCASTKSVLGKSTTVQGRSVRRVNLPTARHFADLVQVCVKKTTRRVWCNSYLSTQQRIPCKTSNKVKKQQI